jgi:tetratricopeptide (TPR) repeat protein
VRSAEEVGQQLLASVARSNIGFVEARAGNRDDAAATLGEAAASLEELQATSFVLETRVRQAEAATLAGSAETALALADEVLADAGDAAEMLPLQSTAHRLRGAALALAGDLDGAGTALDRSIAVAREGNATFQLALALDLLALVDGDRDAASESAELLARLGVVSVARPPLEG